MPLEAIADPVRLHDALAGGATSLSYRLSEPVWPDVAARVADVHEAVGVLSSAAMDHGGRRNMQLDRLAMRFDAFEAPQCVHMAL